MDEIQLIKECKQNNQESIEELISKYKYLVRRIARRYFLIGSEQDDLLQEGMVGLYKAILSYDENINASFYAFASLCIDSQIKTAVKKANRLKNMALNQSFSTNCLNEEDDESEFLLISSVLSPEEKIISEEECKYIKKQINDKLTDKQKVILKLFLRGLTYKEISEMVDCNKKYVDNTLRQLRKKLSYLKD